MSFGALAYLAGMLAMFGSERMLVDSDLQWPVRMIALFALFAALVLRVRELPRAKGEGLQRGNRIALGLLVVGIGSLGIYYLTTDGFVQGMQLDDEAQDRWLGATKSLWPLVWLLGTVPMLVIDVALQRSPVVMPVGRIRDAFTHGLVAAMGIAMVFPMNFVAKETNERWDLAYFKTPSPGTATLALVDALEKPVTVRIFMPPSSEVAQELRAYFAQLEGPKLSIEIVDQAADPKLSKALSVRDNGTVAITMGDVAVLMKDQPITPPLAEGEEKPEPEEPAEAKPVTRRIKVNPEFDKAKRTLKKIDREVQKALIELGQGDRIAYLTSGHDELNWSGQGNPIMTIKEFRRQLIDLGFEVKQLSLREGLGEKVPDDASVVMVIGPRRQFLGAEVNALRDYIQRGGSLLISMPPKIQVGGAPPVEDPLDGLLEELGVKRAEGMLASERDIVTISRNKQDRLNVYTNSFTSHGSSRELAKLGKRDILFVPGAGYLDEVEGRETDVTFTVRSLSTQWADLDLDAEFSADKGESKEVRTLVAAISGGGDGARWRAIVSVAPTAFVDLALLKFKANGQFVTDGVNWLIGAEALTGTTESEEDVKIEHTKEVQITWFYGTVLGVPLLVLVLGGIRVRLRHKPVRFTPPEGPGAAAAAVGSAIAAQRDKLPSSAKKKEAADAPPDDDDGPPSGAGADESDDAEAQAEADAPEEGDDGEADRAEEAGEDSADDDAKRPAAEAPDADDGAGDSSDDEEGDR